MSLANYDKNNKSVKREPFESIDSMLSTDGQAVFLKYCSLNMFQLGENRKKTVIRSKHSRFQSSKQIPVFVIVSDFEYSGVLYGTVEMCNEAFHCIIHLVALLLTFVFQIDDNSWFHFKTTNLSTIETYFIYLIFHLWFVKLFTWNFAVLLIVLIISIWILAVSWRN